ncbi:guanosine-diphosphatase [Coprinopsis cinerea okayama7|uniref:guanosine-diphosphatase n=1 Tax=Coprinopsis cinerea (strain Okayama-7 / 130 / ATCC MYA-4618 / FGSC 9003) TaxID=240176 RepID=A8NPR8_COPC7|nr:guanosine-diphosphatase [Coprinopsis cinerea okayama7\|eukprot:XP_001835385.2 guanosine-diphosphatase [Coprinopsis cinerea okayama7\
MAMAAMSIVSPRSGNYDRLEGGMGPSRLGPPQRGWRRFGWKKFAIGAALLIGFVWLWGPRERNLDWESVKDYTKGLGKDLIPFNPINKDTDSPPPPSVQPPTNAPTSFESDPDPSKTAYCTTPHDPTKPLVQWALMIDAGSTGSRIHIYKFNNCKSSITYEYEVFKMMQPGLSSFADDPEGAARSLDVLLDEAVRVVPEDMQSCTPVAVKATAGLRLLEGRKSEDILEKVEERIRRRYKFQLPDENGVEIMDGKDEGVYAWITANYLLGTIAPGGKPKTTVGKKGSNTYAVLDLGGASTQIVFEPSSIGPASPLEPGEHKYDLDFSGSAFELYQHSYLGYGLMRARSHVHRLVDFMAGIRPRPAKASKYHPVDVDGDGEPDYEVVPNPCLARGMEKVVEVQDEFFDRPPSLDDDDDDDDEPLTVKRNVTMSGLDIGSFEACDKIVQLVLAKDAICEMKPCSFNGVYQPNLLDSFKNGKVLLLSYFYDRLHRLLPPPPSSSSPKTSKNPTIALTPSPPLTVSSIATYAKTICAGPETWSTIPHFTDNKKLMEELEGRPEWCLDLTFMHGLLKWGYEFEEGRRVELGKSVGGTELGWCLGATLGLVGEGRVRCRA